MSMNSFSFFARSDSALNAEISGLFDLNKAEGEVYPASHKVNELKKVNYKPVQMDKLKKKFSDPYEKRRSATRYDLRLSILICNHKKAVRSKCENISLSGIKITEDLPTEFGDGFFDVIIIQENFPQLKKHLLFRGRMVGGNTASKRIYFESIAKDSQNQLFKLIKELMIV